MFCECRTFRPDFFGIAAQQTKESELQLVKRRVEREAADYKQKALGYEASSLSTRVSF